MKPEYAKFPEGLNCCKRCGQLPVLSPRSDESGSLPDDMYSFTHDCPMLKQVCQATQVTHCGYVKTYSRSVQNWNEKNPPAESPLGRLQVHHG